MVDTKRAIQVGAVDIERDWRCLGNFYVSGGGWSLPPSLSDWWARRATIKNNGIREAEMRLPALIPFVCFFIISHVVGAVGYQRLWPWQAILVCGFGFSGLAVTNPNLVSSL